MTTGKSFITVKVDSSQIDEARLDFIRLTSAPLRREAVRIGAEAALVAVKGYYGRGGRYMWENKSLSTHGPGRTSTNWFFPVESGWHISSANGTSTTLSNNTVGLAHKVTGGTIRAKRKRFLTIPIDPRAHGRSAADFASKFGKLFAVKGVLAISDGEGGIKPIYALRKSVTHAPWPGALPPENQYVEAFADAAIRHIVSIMET
jgi:hypothetical protein